MTWYFGCDKLPNWKWEKTIREQVTRQTAEWLMEASPRRMQYCLQMLVDWSARLPGHFVFSCYDQICTAGFSYTLKLLLLDMEGFPLANWEMRYSIWTQKQTVSRMTSTLFFAFYKPVVAQTVKRLPAMRDTRVRFLGWEGPLEKEMTIHFSTLAWKIPWTEEPDRLQSMGCKE